MDKLNSIESVIKLNNEIFSFNNHEIYGNLLIEEPSTCFTTHALAIQAIVVCTAKKIKPFWIYDKKTSIKLLQSYDRKATYIKKTLFLLGAIKVIFHSIVSYYKVITKNDVLSFKYDGIKYGDIVYDVYLNVKQVGSLHKIDLKVLELICKCILRHEIIKKAIKKYSITTVLASHRIGINSGVLVRAGLKYGCEVYTNAGLHRNTLFRSTSFENMIEYEYTPQIEEIEEILSLKECDFQTLYEGVLNFHMNGNSSMDAKFAFSSDKKIYTKKDEFCNVYKLNPDKKNIFVMLHAFTDFPHSHFKWMIFKDYADWFLKTLEFAKIDTKVNWIFKRHPSDNFYPTKDIDYKSLFSNTASNVILLDIDNKVDTRSLIHVADAVVTCLGSAGFELSAMGGIPAITAADNHYANLGFSLNPTNKEEYFSILKSLDTISKLSDEQQKRAQAAYIFIYYLATVRTTINPILNLEDHHNKNFDEIFWEKVLEIYKNKKEDVVAEMQHNIKEVMKPDFKALRTKIDIDAIKKGVQ